MIAKPEPGISSSVKSGSVSSNSRRHSGLLRETRCASGPVCQTLNSQLQTRLNPARGQGERPHGALPLRVGDRVIQTHNNYLLGVFNGDTGTKAGHTS